MKVRIDPDICSGFGICLNIAPERFELHDDGYAIVRFDDVAWADRDTMERAVNQCPAQAISLVED